jgi:hypothetical protein
MRSHSTLIDSTPSAVRIDSRSRTRSDWGEVNWLYTRETCAMACLLFREQSRTVGVRPNQTHARSTRLTDYTTRWDTICPVVELSAAALHCSSREVLRLKSWSPVV